MNNIHKHIIISTGLLLFCVLLLWQVFLPTISDIKVYNKQVKQEKQKLSKLLKQGQSVIENRKNLAQLLTQIDNLNDIWLKTGNELTFITDLEKIAKNNELKQNIIFDNTKTITAKKLPDIKIIPIELKITGEINNIMKYLNQLETLNYYINLTRINLHTQNSNTKKFPTQTQNSITEQIIPQKTILSANLSGVTYWQ